MAYYPKVRTTNYPRVPYPLFTRRILLQHQYTSIVYFLDFFLPAQINTMPQRLQGKVAIVTGGASGFGRGIATKFVAEGARVIVADLAADAGEAVARELNNNESTSSSSSPGAVAHFHRADITRREDWAALLTLATSTWGGLDIVVNNAGGTYPNKPTEQVTDADFDLCFNLNVRSVYMSASVLLPYFLDSGRPGAFVNVASTAGVRPRPGLAWYNASKAAVINATKSLAVEYGPRQVRFNAVAPVFGSNTGL